MISIVTASSDSEIATENGVFLVRLLEDGPSCNALADLEGNETVWCQLLRLRYNYFALRTRIRYYYFAVGADEHR